MTSSGVTNMAGDGSLMGAAVAPHAVSRQLPGWVTPLLQSIALVLVLLGLAFVDLSIYLCVPVPPAGLAAAPEKTAAQPRA